MSLISTPNLNLAFDHVAYAARSLVAKTGQNYGVGAAGAGFGGSLAGAN
jgi:hypothetical protein